MKVEIKDLKGVGNVELTFDNSKQVFVLLGSNGTGKTKTLEALLCLFLAQTRNFHASYAQPKSKRIFQKIHDDFTNLDTDLALISDHIYFERLFEQKNNCRFDAIAYLGAKQRSLSNDNQRNTFEPLGSFEKRREKYNNILFNAIAKNHLAKFGMDQDIHQWFFERAQSVNPYQKSEDNRKIDIDAVLQALHQLDSRFDKTLNIDGDGHVFLGIQGQERELNELSSGFISIVKIIQSIIAAYSACTNSNDLLNVNGVVLIDEIESHLHIEWQAKIIPTLKALFPNTTFYIATHSPMVLSQLQEGEAYLLKRENDGVVRSEKIDSPNKRLLQNVLKDAFNIDLNQLKRKNMESSDQSDAKKRLLALLGDE